MQFLSIAAAALVAATPALATGSAYVVNKCDFNVTLWSVSADTKVLTPNTIVPGANYSEAYQTPSVGGVSLKLSDKDTCDGPITQFEYTLAGPIWYDISNVNCQGTECPFQAHGMYLESGASCPTRSCIAGEPTCAGAYTASTDNWNSLSCDSSADISLYLCTSTAPSKREVQEEFGVPAHRRRLAHNVIRRPHSRR